MNNSTRPHPDPARASIARELSRYYAELAGSEGSPAPNFSLARVIENMAHPTGLRDGYEREICAATAVLAGATHDPHRVLVPLAALRRDLSAGAAPAGGYLVSTDAADPVDVLRPWSVALSAGVQVITGLQGNLALPRVTTAGSGYWLTSESAQITETQPTVGQVAMTPKNAAALVDFSRLWRLQVDASEAFLRDQLLRAVGELLDVAFFGGAGTVGEPLGLINTAGIGTASGGTMALAALLEMRDEVLQAGGREDRLQWVGHPGVQRTLAARERNSGGGRNLWDDGGILGRPAHATRNAPSGALICGDFGASVIGIWGPAAVRVEINPFQNFAAGLLSARVILSCDLGFPHPAAFNVASSVT